MSGRNMVRMRRSIGRSIDRFGYAAFVTRGAVEEFVLALIAMRAELLTATALLGGWALVTAAIADLVAVIPLVGPGIAHAAWLASSGLFLLALCGRDLIARLVRMGLYVLTREDER